MDRHNELRKKLDGLNLMFRSEAALFITEILKYIMDTIQPERSKREDCKCPVVERWTTGNPPTFLGKEKLCRCGALNSMET